MGACEYSSYQDPADHTKRNDTRTMLSCGPQEGEYSCLHASLCHLRSKPEYVTVLYGYYFGSRTLLAWKHHETEKCNGYEFTHCQHMCSWQQICQHSSSDSKLSITQEFSFSSTAFVRVLPPLCKLLEKVACLICSRPPLLYRGEMLMPQDFTS